MKKVFCLILAVISCFAIVACSQQGTEAVDTVSYEEVAGSISSEPSTEPQSDEKSENEEIGYELQPGMIELIDSAKRISIGDSFEVENILNITIEDKYLADEVNPTAPGTSYLNYAYEPGYVYIVIKCSAENISDNEFGFDSSAAIGGNRMCVTQFVIDNKCYGGWWVSEESDGSSLTSHIDSGSRTKLYIVSSVPEDIVDNINDLSGVLIAYDDYISSVTSLLGEIDISKCTNKFYIK